MIRSARHAVLLAVTTLVAIALFVAGSARAGTDTALKLNNASGSVTSYQRVTNAAGLALQRFTIEAWVQRVGIGYGVTTDAGGSGIISKPAEGTVGSFLGSWYLDWNNSGQAYLSVTHTYQSNGTELITPAVTTPLARHHLAATFDGDSVRVYIDGVIASRAAWVGGSVYYGSQDVLIGADNFGAGYLRRFDGLIDDVRIWDHARTGAEIAAQMNCRLAGSESGLVAYWPYDDSTLQDATGHGHDGTPFSAGAGLGYASLATLQNCSTTSVDGPAAPVSTVSMSVGPQPTRGGVTIRFELPRAGLVSLDLFDVAGRELGSLGAHYYPSGTHVVRTDLASLGLVNARPGVDRLRLTFEGHATARPVVVVR